MEFSSEVVQEWSPERFSQILPNLWLGGVDEAELAVRHCGITHVLTIYDEDPLEVLKEFPHVQNLFINIDDNCTQNILQHFDRCVDWLTEALKDPNTIVIVHCMAGISRSTSIVAAYLMKTRHISLEEAMKIITKARQFANPNVGFRKQLDLYEKMGYTVDTEHGDYKQWEASYKYPMFHCWSVNSNVPRRI